MFLEPFSNLLCGNIVPVERTNAESLLPFRGEGNEPVLTVHRVRGVVNFSTDTVNTEHELLTLLCVDVTPELGSERPVRTSQARGLGTKKMIQKEAIMSTKAQGASPC